MLALRVSHDGRFDRQTTRAAAAFELNVHIGKRNTTGAFQTAFRRVAHIPADLVSLTVSKSDREANAYIRGGKLHLPCPGERRGLRIQPGVSSGHEKHTAQDPICLKNAWSGDCDRVCNPSGRLIRVTPGFLMQQDAE